MNKRAVQRFGFGLLVTLSGVFSFGFTYAFSDVNSDHASRHIYEHLRDIGVMTPQANNAFAPNRQVTRAEAMAIALRSSGKGFKPFTETNEVVNLVETEEGTVEEITAEPAAFPFADVSAEWQQTVVYTALRQGLITTEYPFEPDAPVTKAVFIDWLTRAHDTNRKQYLDRSFDLSTDIGHTSPFAPAFAFAKEYHIVHLHPDGAYHAFAPITRHQAATYTYRLREVLFSDNKGKKQLRMRAAFQNFLSAFSGQRFNEAERHAIALRDYSKQIVLQNADDNALAADAIARATDHFVTALRAFEHNRSERAWAEMLLCSKQLTRAQEVPSDLSAFAAEFEQMLLESMTKLGQG